MISRLRGTLVSRNPGWIEVETAGGVVYELEVPLTVLQHLPGVGTAVEVRTAQVVSENSMALFAFNTEVERNLFRRLLTGPGVGTKLALAMMSTFTAERLIRALLEKDIVALQQVSGVGKKKGEKILLELSDKMTDLAVAGAGGDRSGEEVRGAQEAVRALVALGYAFADADVAVRRALEEGAGGSADDLIRKALSYR